MLFSQIRNSQWFEIYWMFVYTVCVYNFYVFMFHNLFHSVCVSVNIVLPNRKLAVLIHTRLVPSRIDLH